MLSDPFLYPNYGTVPILKWTSFHQIHFHTFTQCTLFKIYQYRSAISLRQTFERRDYEMPAFYQIIELYGKIGIGYWLPAIHIRYLLHFLCNTMYSSNNNKPTITIKFTHLRQNGFVKSNCMTRISVERTSTVDGFRAATKSKKGGGCNCHTINYQKSALKTV